MVLFGFPAPVPGSDRRGLRSWREWKGSICDVAIHPGCGSRFAADGSGIVQLGPRLRCHELQPFEHEYGQCGQFEPLWFVSHLPHPGSFPNGPADERSGDHTRHGYVCRGEQFRELPQPQRFDHGAYRHHGRPRWDVRDVGPVGPRFVRSRLGVGGNRGMSRDEQHVRRRNELESRNDGKHPQRARNDAARLKSARRSGWGSPFRNRLRPRSAHG